MTWSLVAQISVLAIVLTLCFCVAVEKVVDVVGRKISDREDTP